MVGQSERGDQEGAAWASAEENSLQGHREGEKRRVTKRKPTRRDTHIFKDDKKKGLFKWRKVKEPQPKEIQPLLQVNSL